MVAQEDQKNPQIHIYKSANKLALVDTSGRQLMLDAVTPKKTNRLYLPNGEYTLYKEFPTCIAKDGVCKSDKNGYHNPILGLDNSFINLKTWGNANRIVYTPMFFYKVGTNPDDQEAMPAIHSEITVCSISNQRKDSCPPAAEKIVPRYDTLGCIRLGSIDLKKVYTFIVDCFEADSHLQIFVHS